MKTREELLKLTAFACNDMGQFQEVLSRIPTQQPTATYLISKGATLEQIQQIMRQVQCVPCDLQTFAEKCVKYGMDIERAKKAMLNGYDLQDIEEEVNRWAEQRKILREMTPQEPTPAAIRKPSLNTRVQDLIRRKK